MLAIRHWIEMFRVTKIKLFLAFWTTAGILWQYRYNSQVTRYNTTDLANHFDVLLNSYMRCGSSFAGKILGWRNDTLYLYEPMWVLLNWSYWHGSEIMCRADNMECSPSDGSHEKAMMILRNFYDCNFDNFERKVFQHGITDRFGGPSWKDVAHCIKGSHKATRLCLQRFLLPWKCKCATHRVTKVLRLSTYLLKDLLRERENLKVIHMFRDPRAVINSRLKTPWYRTHIENNLSANAASLCNKMLHDFRNGKQLLHMYPDRFKFIFYEDLTENPLHKAKLLYNYLGMNLNESIYPQIKQILVSKLVSYHMSDGNKNNPALRWKMTLKFETAQQIDRICENVHKALGYRSYKTLQEYRNISATNVNVPKEFLIT